MRRAIRARTATRRCRRGSPACRWWATSASTSSPSAWCAARSLEAYADPAMVTPERVKRTAELQRFPGNREATLARARTQEPLDPTPLKRLDVPTLILWGGQDRWVPAADAFRFQSDIKGAKLEIFEALGHNPMEEDPKATAEAVAAFLRPIQPRAPRRRRAAGDRPDRPSLGDAGEGFSAARVVAWRGRMAPAACLQQRHHLARRRHRRSPRSLPWCGSGWDAGRRRRRARSPANRFARRRRRRSPWSRC